MQPAFLRKFALLLLLPILLSACTDVMAPPAAAAAPAAVTKWIIVTKNPNATGTPTPFQPSNPTPTFTPRPTPTATKTPIRPTSVKSIPDLPVINLLLLGSDQRAGDSGFRTDTIIFVSIHPEDGTVRAVSIPRDLWLFIPGWGMNRINVAMAIGGFPMLAETFSYNFGVRPQHYVMVNFQGFVDIVKSLDSIRINAAKELIDRCDLRIQKGGYCSVGPGIVDMDGPTALWYARSRHTSSDFDRLRRQQEVIQGIFKRLLDLNSVFKLPALYKSLKNNFQTDLSVEDVTPYLPLGTHMLRSSNISKYVLTPREAWPYTIPENGAMVLLPNAPAIRSIFQRAIGNH